MRRELGAMKRLTIIVCVALGVSALPASAHRTLQPVALPANAGDYVFGQAVVRFNANSSHAERLQALAMSGARLIKELLVPNYALVSVQGGLGNALARLRRASAITEAEPNYRLELQATPNDPCNALDKRSDCPTTAWHLFATAAIAGWQRFPGVYFSPTQSKDVLPARVKIAIIDTPIARSNPDFKNGSSSDDMAFGGQLDVASMNAFPDPVAAEGGPYGYHGTYVASIAAASADNNYGSAGVGYAADLLPLAAVHGSDGRADSSVVADAILFAHEHGARVINLSLGLTDPSSVVNQAIQQVTSDQNPSLVVAAAGNNTGNQPFYPAWFDNVMAVGGTDQLDRKASCANYSSHVAVAAPAKGVEGLSSDAYMTAPDCGTSAATPQVSALAALLFAQDPTRTPDDVESIIEQTADHLGTPGRNDQFGFGRINVDRALAFSSNAPVTTEVSATPVRPSGGESILRANVNGQAPIAGAELYIDRVPSGAADSGYPLGPTDGDFDSTSETVGTSFSASFLAPGPHRIFVRARDITGAWGPLGSGLLFVDDTPPTISNLQATDTIRPLASASSITFNAVDNYSLTLTYTIDITDATGLKGEVWSSGLITAPAGNELATWTPQPNDLPGRYNVKLAVRDEAGNESVATTSMTLV
ncbi:MAG: S8 family serine peptidase [Actinomycetota bacterium]